MDTRRRRDVNDLPDDRDRLRDAIVEAGTEAMRVRLAGYMSASVRAVRTYLLALKELQLSAEIGRDLRAAGLDLPVDPFGSPAEIEAKFRQLARGAVEAGFLVPDDPLIAGVVPG